MPATNTIRLPLQRLDAQLSATSTAGEERRAALRWYTGQRVLQWNPAHGGVYDLTLSLAPGCCNLDLFKTGRAPILDTHSDYKASGILGHVENGRIENGVGVGDAVFLPPDPERPNLVADVDRIWHAVKNKAITSVSVGASVEHMRETTKEGAPRRAFEADRWTVKEVSVCATGADSQATIKASEAELNECEIEFAATAAEKGEVTMEKTTDTTAAAAAATTNLDAEAIRKVAGVCKLAAFGEDLIGHGVGINEARAALLDRMAEQSVGDPRHVHLGARDERDGLVEAMSEGLAVRFSGKEPSERAREFVGARLGDLAGRICQVNGLRPRSMNPAESIRLAASTSDFPLLLQGTGQRVLLNSYEQAAAPIKKIARAATADDFRAKMLLRLGEMPDLVKVPESGEITHGPRTEQAQSYSLATFARMFSLTRQAIINDDLGAFSDYFAAFGAAAARLEGAELVALLAANSGLGANMYSDALPLFDVAHGNVATSPAVINVANLGIMRQVMRLQTGVDGTTILGIAPRYLVVPPELETVGEQYIALLSAGEPADVNPFSGKLTLVCVAELSNVDNNAWMLFADPAVAPVLEYSYLSSQPGPQIETRQGWEVLGAEFRCFEDFGAGLIGTVGATRNAGA
jgi:type IV secretory pathway VirB2 component (pilin)